MQDKNSTNPATLRNNLAFGILLILLQVGSSIIYGFCITNTFSYINVTSIIITIGLAMLTIAGFGLVFSYLKRLTWSGIGFAFLITALCIQFYPLVNAFWTKTAIQKNPTANTFGGSSASNYFNLFLSNLEIIAGANYGNTVTTAIKCALSILVAFSSILGRAGPLECLIVTLLGSMGFELNRQIISNLGQDSFGTFSIFTFGGFMGLALGVILYLKQRRSVATTTEKHPQFTSNKSNVMIAIFGSLIIFLFFPLLAFDLETFHTVNTYNYYTGPFFIVMAMGAAIVGAVIFSVLINGSVVARDLIHAPIAGGIIGGSASFFITAPVYIFVVGFTGGAVQTVLQNVFQKGHKGGVISSISWTLFGVQGILGGVFATGYRNILNYNSNGFTLTPQSINFNPGYELLICVISAGIGLGFGAIIGLIVAAVNGQTREGHFEDKEYWINNDGIYKEMQREESQGGLEIVIGAVPTKKEPVRMEGPIVDNEQGEIYFQEYSQSQPKNNFAYL